MVTVTISSELYSTLQKLAEEDQLSVDELVENILVQYIKLRLSGNDKLNADVTGVLLQSITEAQRLWYSQKETEINTSVSDSDSENSQ